MTAAAVNMEGTDARLPVARQFDDAAQQAEAASLGMWLFLATEVLFFGVLFFAYGVARARYPDAFAAASRHTNLLLGTTNTAVLLTSSFTMALAVHAAQLRRLRASALLLVVTAVLGLAFAGVKLAEYALDYRGHLVPVLDFAFDPRYAQRDPRFRGFGRARTEADGSYTLRTIMPGASPDRAPHINAMILAIGLTRRLVTTSRVMVM